jgi:FlaA1/EpsC-like NDP-sugar epimerase
VLARAVNDRRLPGFRAAPRGRRNVLIVGAGQGGRLVCQELSRNADLGLHPVGFVDDDPLKQRLRFEGVRVRGTTRELPQILDEAEPDEVIIAIPSAPGELRMRVVQGVPRARHSGAHAAHGVRAALGLGRHRAPGARRAGRGRARPRAVRVDLELVGATCREPSCW